MLRNIHCSLWPPALFNRVVSQKFAYGKKVGIGKAQTLWAFGEAGTAPSGASKPATVGHFVW